MVGVGNAFGGQDHRYGDGMIRPIASLMPGLPGGNAGGGGQRDAKTLPPPSAHGRAAAFRGRSTARPGHGVAGSCGRATRRCGR